MKKNINKIIIIFLILSCILISNFKVFAAGKRIIAENKYIWVYVNGERTLIADEDGYACFGQGIDNKNVLYVPLKVICDVTGYKVSPLKKSLKESSSEEDKDKKEYDIFVNVSNGSDSFNINLGSIFFNGVRLSGEPFVLKGTESSGNPVVMVPLGIAKDYFNLDVEVKRPVGRGVYDYCSLAINFSGEYVVENEDIIDVPNGDDSIERPNIKDEEIEDEFYYVSTANTFYHSYNCSKLNKSYSRLSEYECIFWGYEKCPSCLEK